MAYPNRDREEMNAIQRDRMERRRNTRRKSMISTTIFIIAIVAVLGLLIFGAVKLLGQNKGDNNTVPVSTAVDATIASDASQPAASQSATQPSATNPNGKSIAPTSPSRYATDPVWNNGSDNNSSRSDEQSQEPATESKSYINEDNVYIDKNHPAPEGTGNSVTYPISGHVDGDFFWNFDADNGNCTVSCDYDFDNQKYIFHIYGASPGTTNLTLYYSDNGETLSESLTISVDENLNATQI